MLRQLKTTLTGIIATSIIACTQHTLPNPVTNPRIETLADSLFINEGLNEFNGLQLIIHEGSKANIVARYDKPSNKLHIYTGNLVQDTQILGVSLEDNLARVFRHEKIHLEDIETAKNIGSNIFDILYDEEHSPYRTELETSTMFKKDLLRELHTQQFIREHAETVKRYVLARAVIEGIAKHYEYGNCLENPPLFHSHIEHLDNMASFSFFVYNSGHGIVHPILETYGQKGREKLLLDYPSPEEYEDLEAYQTRILKELREEFLADSLNQAFLIPEQYPEHTLNVLLGKQHALYIAFYDFETQTTTINYDDIYTATINELTPTIISLFSRQQERTPRIDTTHAFAHKLEEVLMHELEHHRTYTLTKTIAPTFYQDLKILHEREHDFRALFDNKHATTIKKRVRTFMKENPEFINYLIMRQFSEGIARATESQPCIASWTNKPEELFTIQDYLKLLYEEGCMRYQPIIEQHGNNGILYAIQHLPTPTEFFQGVEYTKKILEQLR